MSDPVRQDPALRDRTTSLRNSGPVWKDRVQPAQRALIREMSLAASTGDAQCALLAAGAWLHGKPPVRGAYSWSFTSKDVRLIGPGLWGYTVAVDDGRTQAIPRTLPGNTIVRTAVDEDYPVLLRDGCVMVIPAGGIISATTTEGLLSILVDGQEYLLYVGNDYALEIKGSQTSVTLDIARETVWFLRVPPGIQPLSLETEKGDFLAGSSFHYSQGWLLLRDNPWELWPDGIAHATSVRCDPVAVRHRALRTDYARTSGYYVAAYKRRSQCPLALLRALAEVAGIPVIREDAVIERIIPVCDGFVHHLSDGNAFTLPLTSYQPSSPVTAGEIAGTLLGVRHLSLQGAAWWQARPWGGTGIDIAAFRPGFSGFSIRDEWVPAVAYADPSGGALRARIVFGQAGSEEERYWLWQAAEERRAGVETFARDVIGFTAAGQTKLVNPLELWAAMLGPWLMVVENGIDAASPARTKEMLDFIEREKPAGSIVALVAV